MAHSRTGAVRPLVMDRPILHPLAAELRESERLSAFAAALPAAARVARVRLRRGGRRAAPACRSAPGADPGHVWYRGVARVTDRGARACRLRARRARRRARPVRRARRHRRRFPNDWTRAVARGVL